MSTLTATLEPPAVENRYVAGFDSGLAGLSEAALMHGGLPGVHVSGIVDRMRERREAFVVWIVLIVAIAVVAVAGIMAYVAIVCINRGGVYSGGLGVSVNGWRVWEYKLRFSCTR